MLSWKRIFIGICYPLVVIRRQYLKWNNKRLAVKKPYIYIGRSHKKYYGVDMDIEHPKTLHEKIYWMEYHTDMSEWARLTDKVAVREYVKECGLGEILNPLYAVYIDMPSKDVLFKDLPNSFVLKTNNSAGGSAILVYDKNRVNKSKILKRIRAYFYEDYGLKTAQPHYSMIQPKILVEKMLQNEENPSKAVTDYKFFCFHGEPKYVNAIANRDIIKHSFDDQYFDINWNRIIYTKEDKSNSVEKPVSFNEMVKIAQILSRPFPFVRVDLYEVDKKPVFGELTFTPGFDIFCKYGNEILHLGDLVDLSGCNIK